MMKKNIFLIIPLLVALFLMSSCDDYLSLKPKGVVIPESTEDYSKLMVAHLMIRGVEDDLQLMLDDIYVYYDNQPNPRGIDYGQYIDLEESCKRFYTFEEKIYDVDQSDISFNDTYYHIYTYNVVINNIMSATGSQHEKELLLGEALIGRAFDYLELVNLYCKPYQEATADKDLGMPIVLSDELDIKGKVRPSLAENFKQIEKDLLDGLELLSERPATTTYRASIPAAYGLLARMYLLKGDYKEALKYSELCLGMKSELLNLNDHKVTREDGTVYRTDIPYGVDSKEVVYLRHASFIMGKTGGVYVSDELISHFDKENDLRWKLLYTDNYGGNKTDRVIWAPGYYINIGIGTPEMYLIAAESAARTNEMPKAYKYLNEFCHNRYKEHVDYTSLNAEETLSIVLKERRREFAFVGAFRLTDLKRLNLDPRFAKDVVHTLDVTDKEGNTKTETYVLEANSYKFVFPIADDVLRFNPDMIQRDK